MNYWLLSCDAFSFFFAFKYLSFLFVTEITCRFQTARPEVRQLLLHYLVPWLHNMELVDPNVPPPNPLSYFQVRSFKVYYQHFYPFYFFIRKISNGLLGGWEHIDFALTKIILVTFVYYILLDIVLCTPYSSLFSSPYTTGITDHVQLSSIIVHILNKPLVSIMTLMTTTNRVLFHPASALNPRNPIKSVITPFATTIPFSFSIPVAANNIPCSIYRR